MKFKVGDLIRFIPGDIHTSGRAAAFYNDFQSRGNRIGIVIEINHLLYDPKVYYTYKIHYQSGYVLWEAEKNLEIFSIES